MFRFKRGAAGQQYVIVVGMIAVVAISAITTAGKSAGSLLDRVSNTFSESANGTIGLPPPPDTTPDPISFNNQTAVTPGMAIASNAVTVSGFDGPISAVCNAGCIAVSRNGGSFTPGGETGFMPGDTIAIQQTASASYLTASTASVTLGLTQSANWSVTTRAQINAPAAFAFTNQTNATVSATVTSDSVTLTGFDGPQTATCGTNCTAIKRNNGAFQPSPVSGFMSGDTITIQMTAAATTTTAKTATVTVGGTTSASWSVTTSACGGSSQSFTTATTSDSLTVTTPMLACTFTIVVKGAGGGGGYSGAGSHTGGAGGGVNFTYVPPATGSFSILVGQGGSYAGNNTTGGGGAGAINHSGSGGGASAVTFAGTLLAISGGGGGGNSFANGGAGGSNNGGGADGAFYNNGSYKGGGGWGGGGSTNGCTSTGCSSGGVGGTSTVGTAQNGGITTHSNGVSVDYLSGTPGTAVVAFSVSGGGGGGSAPGTALCPVGAGGGGGGGGYGGGGGGSCASSVGGAGGGGGAYLKPGLTGAAVAGGTGGASGGTGGTGSVVISW